MKKLFLWLAILNAADGILSFVGLQFSLMEEANPVMDKLYHLHPVLFVFVKLLLSLALILIAFMTKLPRTILIKSLAVFATFSYFFIMILHGIWITSVVFAYPE